MKPVLGIGTWLFPSEKVEDIIKIAIRDYGYRQIDTAKMYENEESVGKAIKWCIDQGIVKKREDLFITTKLWIDGRDRVEEELRGSLKRLGLEYVDMYIMHFMLPDIDKDSLEVSKTSLMDVWRELEKCQPHGLTRSIGVSNC
jgi:diketogulonate reductase-like aldo/keto reductase